MHRPADPKRLFRTQDGQTVNPLVNPKDSRSHAVARVTSAPVRQGEGEIRARHAWPADGEGRLILEKSQVLAEDHSVTDFIGVKELAALTGFAPKTIYFQHSTQHGALVPILSKLGRKLGAWRGDYETWRNRQRKLQPGS